ncbi:MAG: DUF885 domain-containing protein [Betaproteobacteria bacterium]|nr:MAG: DUF885 domain-containing protein [Betaproteobacteria bacterium]
MKINGCVRAGLRSLLIAAFVLLASGCQQPTRPTATLAAAPAASGAWDAYVSEFLESHFAARPNHAVWAGRHEFDGKLPDLSAAGIRKDIARLHSERDRAASFADSSLNDKQRFERFYLQAAIERDLFWRESAEWPFVSPGFYGWPLDPNVYVSREYAPLEQRMRAYILYAKAIPTATLQIRLNLRTPLPRTYVQLGHIMFGGLASYYESDVPPVFAEVKDAPLQEEFRAANAGAIKAMKELDAWFTQQEAGATDKFALGPEKFSEMLRKTEQVDIPLSRLKEIGERDLDRNLTALRDACAKFAPGQILDACVAKAQADKPMGTPVEAASKQLGELRAFVQQRKIVTIPGPEQAKVAESPPYRRWNPAYISIPGPYEKNLPSVYYISPPDPRWTKAEQIAYIPAKAELLFISAHEVWPGHFLQFLHSNRASSKLGQLFSSYAFNEGWAHYTEEMMWEVGIGDGDPEVHIGQLLNALVRDVRYLSSLGLHTGGMTVSESEAMFREKAFQGAAGARQQAARGTFDPEYGSYTLGKLMIRKLRDDWTATRGGRSAWQAFHDELLHYGAPPIPLLRKAMMGGETGSLL